MYNGIGLPTPRGSGTSGYIQKNLSHLKPRRTDFSLAESATGGSGWGKNSNPPPLRKPNQELLEHERRRQVEIKLLRFADELRNNNVAENHIEERVAEERQRLLALLESDELKVNESTSFNLDTNQASQLKREELARMREALNIQSDDDVDKTTPSGQDKDTRAFSFYKKSTNTTSQSTHREKCFDKNSGRSRSKNSMEAGPSKRKIRLRSSDGSCESIAASVSSRNTSSKLSKDRLPFNSKSDAFSNHRKLHLSCNKNSRSVPVRSFKMSRLKDSVTSSEKKDSPASHSCFSSSSSFSKKTQRNSRNKSLFTHQNAGKKQHRDLSRLNGSSDSFEKKRSKKSAPLTPYRYNRRSRSSSRERHPSVVARSLSRSIHSRSSSLIHHDPLSSKDFNGKKDTFSNASHLKDPVINSTSPRKQHLRKRKRRSLTRSLSQGNKLSLSLSPNKDARLKDQSPGEESSHLPSSRRRGRHMSPSRRSFRRTRPFLSPSLSCKKLLSSHSSRHRRLPFSSSSRYRGRSFSRSRSHKRLSPSTCVRHKKSSERDSFSRATSYRPKSFSCHTDSFNGWSRHQKKDVSRSLSSPRRSSLELLHKVSSLSRSLSCRKLSSSPKHRTKSSLHPFSREKSSLSRSPRNTRSSFSRSLTSQKNVSSSHRRKPSGYSSQRIRTFPRPSFSPRRFSSSRFLRDTEHDVLHSSSHQQACVSPPSSLVRDSHVSRYLKPKKSSRLRSSYHTRSGSHHWSQSKRNVSHHSPATQSHYHHSSKSCSAARHTSRHSFVRRKKRSPSSSRSPLPDINGHRTYRERHLSHTNVSVYDGQALKTHGKSHLRPSTQKILRRPNSTSSSSLPLDSLPCSPSNMKEKLTKRKEKMPPSHSISSNPIETDQRVTTRTHHPSTMVSREQGRPVLALHPSRTRSVSSPTNSHGRLDRSESEKSRS